MENETIPTTEPEPIKENNFSKWKGYLEGKYNPTTIKYYSWVYSLFDKSPEEVTQEDINKFLKPYRNKNKIINRNNPFYKGFINAYIKCFNLPFKIEKLSIKGGNAKKEGYKFLNKEQIDLILSEAEPKISLISRLFFETGLRLRELILSEKTAFNLDTRKIEGIGKHNKPFSVEFSQKTAELLKVYFEQNPENTPFFLTKSKDPPRTFYYFFAKECKRLGLGKVTPHQIRHSLAHYLRVVGFDLPEIKVKLRHSDISSTQIYAVATAQEVNEKIKKVVFEE